jgi:anti-sigma B factor antagonist
MKITEKKLENAVILEASGKLTIGVGDTVVREAIDKAQAEGVDNVIMDMAAVTALDSAGVGEILAAHSKLKNAGGGLALIKLSDRVGGVLKATRLTGLISIHDDVSSALESF